MREPLPIVTVVTKFYCSYILPLRVIPFEFHRELWLTKTSVPSLACVIRFLQIFDLRQINRLVQTITLVYAVMNQTEHTKSTGFCILCLYSPIHALLCTFICFLHSVQIVFMSCVVMTISDSVQSSTAQCKQCDCFRWRMQYKLADLRRAYDSWSAEMRMMADKLQYWSADISQRLAQWSSSITDTWPSLNHLQRRLTDFANSLKITLMGTSSSLVQFFTCLA